jgi:hypothetical protein
MNTSSQLRLFRIPLIFAFAATALFSLAGCGSTSGLQNQQGQAIASTRKFTKVTVQTFKLKLVDKDPEMNSEKSPAYFADRIAFELKAKGRFASVGRDAKPDADTLVIDGTITKYHEGNPMLRAFIGFGAGSAFFEADVYFRDSKGNIVGKIKADKNSWALGGAIAGAQNPTMFMNGAAVKIADEAVKLR